MELNLRQAITAKVRENSVEELKEVIQDSIGNIEMTLPGLGVLFEIIWSNSAAAEQQRMAETLHEHLKNQSAV